jgi:hypothetical protein
LGYLLGENSYEFNGKTGKVLGLKLADAGKEGPPTLLHLPLLLPDRQHQPDLRVVVALLQVLEQRQQRGTWLEADGQI